MMGKIQEKTIRIAGILCVVLGSILFLLAFTVDFGQFINEAYPAGIGFVLFILGASVLLRDIISRKQSFVGMILTYVSTFAMVTYTLQNEPIEPPVISILIGSALALIFTLIFVSHTESIGKVRAKNQENE